MACVRSAAAACVAALSLLAAAGCSDSSPATPPEDPTTFSAELWEIALGGDDPTGDGLTDERLAPLNDRSLSALSDDEFEAAATVAVEVVAGEVTGQAAAELGGFWPDWTHRAGGRLVDGVDRCETVQVDAVNPQPLPGLDGLFKVAVVWSADSCPISTSEDPTGRAVSFVFVEQAGDVWRPVRPATLPGARPLWMPFQSEFPLWALEPLECVGDGTVIYARAEVAAAWAEMCAAAAADFVKLEAADAFRSPADQQRRFDDAVEFFGDANQASRYVAESDGIRCASRHCAGEAIDITEDEVAFTWMNTVVGCASADAVRLFDTAAGTCATSERPVTRSMRYGFAATLPHSPAHLDFVVPLAPLDGAGCMPPPGSQMVQIVSSVWRCVLTQAGVVGDDATRVVAEALTVAECESGLDPTYVAFDGQFLVEPHPVTARSYDRRGLFGVPAGWVAAFAGGDASPFDPAVSSAVAAQTWVAERAAGRSGWDPFGCAVGDAFREPALPQFGGPELPSWAVSAAGV